MSDSIEKDEEFRKLVKMREKLEREIAAVFSYEMLLGEYDNDKRLHNLQLEASRARKEIYRYIDRRVERAVLEERAKQPISVNKIKSDELMSFKASGPVNGLECPAESLSLSLGKSLSLSFSKGNVMHQNSIIHEDNIVKINFKDVNSFDWNGLGVKINNLAKSKYPLMFTLEKAHMWTVREISFKGSVVEFALLFMFKFNEETYQVTIPSIYQWVTNEIIVIDINDILYKAHKEVNAIVRRAMEDEDASK